MTAALPWGFTDMPLRTRERVTGARRNRLRAKVAAQYNRGLTIRELAASMGRSYGFVHTLLSEAGVAFRSWGGARRRTQRR
jgi:DNA-directed RNA polymerase specialized sigma24 family protein